MTIKDIPEDDIDRRVLRGTMGHRVSGDMTRMSIDMTRAERIEFTKEAIDHDMTSRAYFYHCWRATQKAQRETNE